jgi:polyhydroxyalkanoate synthesis repressor PhaR
MPVIKRYPNRKLYDTEAKQYITLDGIATLIRQGHEIQVLDHASGEDMTAVTLTQIIFEQEKKRRGFLPQAVLTGLIQAGGERMSTLRRTLASPLEIARQVDEEIERRLHALISRGELAAEDGVNLRDMLLSHRRRSSGDARPTEQDLEQILKDRGVPSQEDLRQILQQLEMLASKLDDISVDSEPARSQ